METQQNASRGSWTFDYTQDRLSAIMRCTHDRCLETADEYGSPGLPGGLRRLREATDRRRR
ncbi:MULTISPECIES: hypothetical protein [Actinomycetes]|uniref:hypothetical protein n=1 Tax=Actinomycetes TaxID=1760 RepID=UPI00143DE5A3